MGQCYDVAKTVGTESYKPLLMLHFMLFYPSHFFIHTFARCHTVKIGFDLSEEHFVPQKVKSKSFQVLNGLTQTSRTSVCAELTDTWEKEFQPMKLRKHNTGFRLPHLLHACTRGFLAKREESPYIITQSRRLYQFTCPC